MFACFGRSPLRLRSHPLNPHSMAPEDSPPPWLSTSFYPIRQACVPVEQCAHEVGWVMGTVFLPRWRKPSASHNLRHTPPSPGSFAGGIVLHPTFSPTSAHVPRCAFQGAHPTASLRSLTTASSRGIGAQLDASRMAVSRVRTEARPHVQTGRGGGWAKLTPTDKRWVRVRVTSGRGRRHPQLAQRLRDAGSV
jgi:hypothetical protein